MRLCNVPFPLTPALSLRERFPRNETSRIEPLNVRKYGGRRDACPTFMGRVKLCRAPGKIASHELNPAKGVHGITFRNFIASMILAGLLLAPAVLFAQARDVDDVDKGGSEAKLTVEASAATANPVLPPKWAFGVLFASY